jgi:hypothetical protein
MEPRETLRNTLITYILLENLEEMDNFLGTFNQVKLNQEEINHLNRYVTGNDTEAGTKSLPRKKSQGPDGFILEIYQTFEEEVIQIVLQLFQERQRE